MSSEHFWVGLGVAHGGSVCGLFEDVNDMSNEQSWVGLGVVHGGKFYGL